MKKILLLIALFLGVVFVLEAQTQNINMSSGIISIDCSQYTNNLNQIWNVNVGQSKRVKIEYNIDTEYNYDFVTIYSINSSGNAIMLLRKSGMQSGIVYSEFPTGKIQVVFTTDYSVTCYYDDEEDYQDKNTGFSVSFSIDDRMVNGPSLFTGPVKFDGVVSGNSTANSLRIQTNYGYIDLGAQDETSTYISTDKSRFVLNKSLYLQSGILSSQNSSNLYFMTNGNYRMSILNSNGNVGIGTTSPYTKLQVQGSVYLPSGNSYWIGNYSDSGNRLRMHHNGSDAYIDYFPNLHFRTGTTSMATFLDNGNVGIGTSSPGYKLEVNGTIRAKEVKIESTNWPDYVFSSQYQLPSLEAVSNHIKENKHLPGIPSAKEVEETGINLGELNAKLLQKIEELTLYVIEQNKRILELEKKLEK